MAIDGRNDTRTREELDEAVTSLNAGSLRNANNEALYNPTIRANYEWLNSRDAAAKKRAVTQAATSWAVGQSLVSPTTASKFNRVAQEKEVAEMEAADARFAGTGEQSLLPSYSSRQMTDGVSVRRKSLDAAKSAAETEKEFRARYAAATSDKEKAAIKNEHAVWVRENGTVSPRALIEKYYDEDISAAQDKVRRGEMSPFEFAEYKRELTNRRDARLQSEADYDAQEEEAKRAAEAAAAEGRRARKELMGITTTAYKAFQRLRDPFMEDDERAVAKEVAGKAASRFAEKFIEENFGYQGEKDNGTDYGNVRYAIEEYEGTDPKTRLKDFGYQITFTDANGRPVIGPDGKPVTKRITESNLEACLTGKFGWKFDGDGNLVDMVGEKTEDERAMAGDPIEPWEAQQETVLGGDRVYGGQKSRKTVELEREEMSREREDKKRENAEWVNQTSGRLLAMEAGEDRDKLWAELAERDSNAGKNLKAFFDAEKKEAEEKREKTEIMNMVSAAYDAIDDEDKFREAIKPLASRDAKLYIELQEAREKRAKGLTEDQKREAEKESDNIAYQIITALAVGAPIERVSVKDADGKEISIKDALGKITGPIMIKVGEQLAAAKAIEEARERNKKLSPAITKMRAAQNKADLLTAYGEAALIDRDEADKVLASIMRIKNMKEDEMEAQSGWFAPPERSHQMPAYGR